MRLVRCVFLVFGCKWVCFYSYYTSTLFFLTFPCCFMKAIRATYYPICEQTAGACPTENGGDIVSTLLLFLLFTWCLDDVSTPVARDRRFNQSRRAPTIDKTITYFPRFFGSIFSCRLGPERASIDHIFPRKSCVYTNCPSYDNLGEI